VIDVTDALEAGYAPGYLTRSLVLPGVWVVVTVIVAVQALSGGPLWIGLLVVCLVVSLFLAVLFGRAVWRAFRGLPLLTLDDEGVTLHSARTHLDWANVAEIRIVPTAKQGRNKVIVFVPVDAQRSMDGLSWYGRWFARDGIRRLGSPVFAPVEGLPIDEVVAAARRFTRVRIHHEHRL
jgi:hypothetical protein